MENKPKKSKALIITIIVIILLLIVGYFVIKNRDIFGVKTSNGIAKIFAPLLPSENTNDLKTIGQASEDINKGDGVSVTGTDENGNSIFSKAGDTKYGYANQDIKSGELGEFTITSGNTNTFFDSFSGFLNNIFNNGGDVTPPPTQGGTNIFPTVVVTASPSSVESGASSTINWTSTNTTSCDAGDGNGTDTSGSFSTGPLLDSKSYTVVCTGANGMSSGNVFVNVIGGTNIFPTIAVTAIPSSVESGASSTISWTSTNTTSCDVGDGNESSTSGSLDTGPLLESKSYTVVCVGVNGKTGGNVFVSVIGGGNDFPTVAVRASPSSVEPEGSSIISWTSTNTISCDAGVNNSVDSSDTTLGSFSTGALSESKSYTVVCTGVNGEDKIGGNVFVNVKGGNNVFPTVTVTASPSSIASGASSTISWTSSNWPSTDTPSCDAGLGNGTGIAGSFETGTLTSSRLYTVTCTGENAGSRTGNTFVSVGIVAPKPVCSDEIDNDTDTLTDADDPNCHLDGDILKDYVPTHDSESSSPESGFPDLKAGAITPASTLINTQTALSSTIRNDGEGSTISEFSSFFTITKINPIDTQTDETGDEVSISKFKNFFSKFPWFSIASAAVNPGFNIVNNSELVITTPIIIGNSSTVVKVNHTFTTSGTYYIRACADKKNISDFGLITESNEMNNCGPWTTFTVSDGLPTPCILPQIADAETGACTNCLPPKITDGTVDPNLCINRSDCLPPNVIVGDKCEVSTACLPPKITDVGTGACIDLSECKAPKIINGNKCEDPAPNVCKDFIQNPLKFTDKEQARLSVLLRKFYLIAPELKTEDDIVSIYSEVDQYKNLMNEAVSLTNECKVQVKNIRDKNLTPAGWNHTNQLRGNPWYRENYGGTFPYGGTEAYLDYNVMELNGAIGQVGGVGGACPLVSGYYSGTTTTGIDCGTYTPPGKCWGDNTSLFGDNDSGFPNAEYLKQGCKWHEGVYLMDVERILNIW
jgi:hypothetical protein